MLRNDHEDITEKINQNIQVLHSAKLAPTSVAAEDTSTDMISISVLFESSQTFIELSCDVVLFSSIFLFVYHSFY